MFSFYPRPMFLFMYVVQESDDRACKKAGRQAAKIHESISKRRIQPTKESVVPRTWQAFWFSLSLARLLWTSSIRCLKRPRESGGGTAALFFVLLVVVVVVVVFGLKTVPISLQYVSMSPY